MADFEKYFWRKFFSHFQLTKRIRRNNKMNVVRKEKLLNMQKGGRKLGEGNSPSDQNCQITQK